MPHPPRDITKETSNLNREKKSLPLLGSPNMFCTHRIQPGRDSFFSASAFPSVQASVLLDLAWLPQSSWTIRLVLRHFLHPHPCPQGTFSRFSADGPEVAESRPFYPWRQAEEESYCSW